MPTRSLAVARTLAYEIAKLLSGSRRGTEEEVRKILAFYIGLIGYDYKEINKLTTENIKGLEIILKKRINQILRDKGLPGLYKESAG